MPKGEKASKPPRDVRGTAQRVRICFELLMAGFTPAEITQQAALNCQKADAKEEHEPEMVWRVSGRSVREYCSKARKLFEQMQALKVEQALGRSLGRREKMFRSAMELGRVNTALRVQDSIDRLNGLDDFNGGGTAPDKPTGIQLPNGTTIYL